MNSQKRTKNKEFLKNKLKFFENFKKSFMLKIIKNIFLPFLTIKKDTISDKVKITLITNGI